MAVYHAVDGRVIESGAWSAVIAWAMARPVVNGRAVKVVRVRPGEHSGRVVAEVSGGEVRLSRAGRVVPAAKLRGPAP